MDHAGVGCSHKSSSLTWIEAVLDDLLLTPRCWSDLVRSLALALLRCCPPGGLIKGTAGVGGGGGGGGICGAGNGGLRVRTGSPIGVG